MVRIEVQTHEPANVLSTMLLILTGAPRDAKLHPIAAHALEHTKPFVAHPSLGWLKAFYKPDDLSFLYGHVAQLAGPVSFAPRFRAVPDYVASYEPERMKELPAKMAAFYANAKLGAFRRKHVPAYTLAMADVQDALDGARIEEFLARVYGPIKHGLVVVPVPTDLRVGGGTGAMTEWEAFAFLHPPRIPVESADPIAWSLDPDRTQVLTQYELSLALLYEATRKRKDLVPRLRPILSQIPPDAPFVRTYRDPDSQFAELFVRGSSVSYLRRTRGDEAALRWMEDQIRRLGVPLVRDFFLTIEEYLQGRRWSNLDTFLEDLPNAQSLTRAIAG